MALTDTPETWKMLAFNVTKLVRDEAWEEFRRDSELMGVPLPEKPDSRCENRVEFIARLTHLLREAPDNFFRSEPIKATTRLGWMETFEEQVSQYSCPECKKIYQYATDDFGTERPPNFCPVCGRRNLRA